MGPQYFLINFAWRIVGNPTWGFESTVKDEAPLDWLLRVTASLKGKREYALLSWLAITREEYDRAREVL